MRFWDSSAITPLLVEEADSGRREEALRADAAMLVWYGTLAEIESALCRRLRENPECSDAVDMARKKLHHLAESWMEVEPTRTVRSRALRLLRVHPLRAADAFQLAAALVAFAERTTGRHFFTGDSRLGAAALAEGFTVE